MVAAAAFAGLVTDLSRLGLSTATADALALHAQQGGMPLDGARARASQVLFGITEGIITGYEAATLLKEQPEYLRLDIAHFPDDYEGGAFFTKLVADAKAVPLEAAQTASLRAEEKVKLDEKMRKVREREAQMAAEESDDEIVFSDEELGCEGLDEDDGELEEEEEALLEEALHIAQQRLVRQHMHAQPDAHARTCPHMRNFCEPRISVSCTCTHMPVHPPSG